MADKKISALTGASTPLAGTEVLPIVQSGSTVKVSVANLTVGRDVTMDSATVNGHVNVLAGDVRFDDERLVYSYAGGTVGQYMSGTYYDGSGLTQRVFLNNAEVGRWTGTDLKIANGNLIIGTSGKGIDFSVTSSGSGTMTSELLSDYEEGTWTPTLVGGTTAGTYSIATTSAYYTKIGRQVTITARMVVTVTVAGTGTAIFGGLPFAKSSAQFLTGSVITTNVTYGLTVISVSVQATTSGSSSDFALAGVRSATSPTDVAVTDIADQAVIIVTFTYSV
jgi:hypothetical protein